MAYWLFKSEPDVFSIQDLKESPRKTTSWEGVRNYQARNLLRDDVKVGDGVLFYHSRVKPMAVVGTAKVVKAAYPDDAQFDKRSRYHDPKATKDAPCWVMVDIKLNQILPQPVTLDEMRTMAALENMVLLRRGSRLSIQPVSAAEWRAVLKRGRASPRRASR